MYLVNFQKHPVSWLAYTTQTPYNDNVVIVIAASLPDQKDEKTGTVTLPLHKSPTILLIGNDIPLGYLLKRYAEHSGYQLTMNEEPMSSREIEGINPAVIIFLSTERLAKDQALLQELDTPILVCSSVVEEARALELGADYCLLHPLTYDDFQAALANVTASKHV